MLFRVIDLPTGKLEPPERRKCAAFSVLLWLLAVASAVQLSEDDLFQLLICCVTYADCVVMALILVSRAW